MRSKVFASILFLLLSVIPAAGTPGVPQHSNNLLILIQPALAGPDVNPLNYWQPQWILWPPSVRDNSGSLLLSVATGDNWVGSAADFQFDAAGSHTWRAKNYRDLVGRGHFEVQRRNFHEVEMALLVGRSGSASPNALRLAVGKTSDRIEAFGLYDRKWPKDHLMVAEAGSWDEVSEMTRATKGRVLVVEYPPKPEVPWSRFWLRGQGWTSHGKVLSAGSEFAVVPEQADFPVPGLIQANHLASFVVTPDLFKAVAVDVHNWPGANRFLEIGRVDGLIFTAIWVVLIAGLMIWSAMVVANEKNSRGLSICLLAIYLSPGIVGLAGSLGRILGIEVWPIWMLVSGLSLVTVSYLGTLLVAKHLTRAHPLLFPSVVGLIVVMSTNPVWSFMGPLLGPHTSFQYPIAFGAVFGYLIGTTCSLRGSGSRWRLASLILCLFVCLVAVGLNCWEHTNIFAMLFFSVGAILILERVPFKKMGLWVVYLGFFEVFRHGWTYDPRGLLLRSHPLGAINLAEYIDFLFSPVLWVFIAVSLWISLFGYRFFFHQLRKLISLDDRRLCLINAACVTVAMGAFRPSFLPMSLVLATGAACSLLMDALQTM